MLRFSIRDMLWLILLIGLALSWWMDRNQLSEALAKAEKWRGRAGTLESVLRDDGWEVKWDFVEDEVTAVWPAKEGTSRTRKYLQCHKILGTEFFPPSADPE